MRVLFFVCFFFFFFFFFFHVLFFFISLGHQALSPGDAYFITNGKIFASQHKKTNNMHRRKQKRRYAVQ